MIREGGKIFRGIGLCSACHGTHAKGGVAPDLTDDTWDVGDGSFESILGEIMDGISVEQSKAGLPMPARGGAPLTDEQVRAVAAYVWSLARKPDPAHP